MSRLKNAADNGMIAMKIMVVPCIAKSCERMNRASMPPITNHAMAVYMYSWPIFLWSVVASQLQMPLSYLCALPVTDGAATVVAIPGLRYFRDERYAARSAIC